VEYVMQEQFLQVRKLFDVSTDWQLVRDHAYYLRAKVICDVQKSRTYIKEQTPIEPGDKF
jgi:hypothetical protein